MGSRRRIPCLYVASVVLGLLISVSAQAAECPALPEMHIPRAPSASLNIDKIKDALRNYHYIDYHNDLSAVYSIAKSYVTVRAPEVKNPAVVLDIDETTLSNWPNLLANDFGFIKDGPCKDLPAGPCGFDAWVLMSRAQAIPPALDFFKAVRSKGVAVIFITARAKSQERVTVRNLKRAGYNGWAKLILREDGDGFATVQAYKAAQREKLAAEYSIIANIGDQDSDLAGGPPACRFKLPNPFYFIP
jgi:predicted secreted acid phosphatase